MLFIVTGLFASIITLKGVYDKRDKGDLYWNYNKILEKPFKFLQNCLWQPRFQDRLDIGF